MAVGVVEGEAALVRRQVGATAVQSVAFEVIEVEGMSTIASSAQVVAQTGIKAVISANASPNKLPRH